MKKKMLTAALLTVAAITLVVTTVFITVAYLTSKAEVTNTFTVGNITLSLYESDVDSDGKALPDNDKIHGSMKDSIGNQYHLIPGKTYAKDPTIYLDAKSDNSYLFVKAQNDIRSIEIKNPTAEKMTMRQQMEANGWVLYKTFNDGSVVYVYGTTKDGKIIPTAVNGTTKGNKGTGSEGVFDTFSTFTVDEDADVSGFTDAKVLIKAFAIQKTQFEGEDNLGDVNAAWEALMEAFPDEADKGQTTNPDSDPDPAQ